MQGLSDIQNLGLTLTLLMSMLIIVIAISVGTLSNRLKALTEAVADHRRAQTEAGKAIKEELSLIALPVLRDRHGKPQVELPPLPPR